MPQITQHEIENTPIKALTWRQPYGQMMLHGKQETRTWKTHYRGLVLICAGVNPYSLKQLENVAGLRNMTNILNTINITESALNMGKAIAIGRLVNCRVMYPTDEPTTFVTFRYDLFVHEYEDVTPIIPAAWKGHLGFRTLSPAQRGAIIIKP